MSNCNWTESFKKYILYCICIFFVIAISTGCMNEDVQKNENQEEMETIYKPVSGGELRIATTSFETLNPVINDNQSVYYLHRLIYEGLIRLDENLEAQKALATSWSVSEDGRTWTFVLRNNVKWHDGEMFSAEDVKFTIDTLKTYIGAKSESPYAVYVKNMKRVKVIRSNEIEVEFDAAVNGSIELFSFPIIPKHKFWSGRQVYNSINMIPVGTGLYKVERNDQFKSIKLSINDQYWGDKPYISSIVAKRIPDKEAALTSVEANEIDMAEATHFEWEKYSENKSLKIYEYITQDYEFLAFNFNKRIFQDKNIRKAIAYAIDRHKIIKDVYLGHATMVDVPIHPKSIFYSEEEKIYGKDTFKSRKLLSESSWENRDNDDWFENEKGQELRFRLLVNKDNPRRIEVANSMKKQLKRVGIDIIIESVDWKSYQKMIFSKKFDMVLGGWQLSPSSDLRFAFHSSYLWNTNFIGYQNEEMNRLLDEVLREKSTSLRKEKYKKLQYLIVEELPYFSLYFKNSSVIMKDHVKGHVMPSDRNIYNNIEKWYLIEK